MAAGAIAGLVYGSGGAMIAPSGPLDDHLLRGVDAIDPVGRRPSRDTGFPWAIGIGAGYRGVDLAAIRRSSHG
jgi:hypothetical protein